jgi:hypothetical protein
MPFHFATLEEYYVGGLWLPVMNGVTDGSAVLIAINIIIGITGSEWWAIERNFLGVTARFSHFCFFAVFAIQVFAVLRNLFEMIKAYRNPVENPEHYREPVVLTLLF